MGALNITNFGGEIPRSPARSLPVGAAQINQNLLATATEFRPTLDHSVVMTGAITGAKTLFRGTRSSTGSRITDAVTGWYTDAQDVSFVKGQLSDDETDVTYSTHDNGLLPPGVYSVNPVTSRRLGVPAPGALTATLNSKSQFTLEQANAWLTSTLQPALKTALVDSLEMAQDKARFIAQATPYAGQLVSVAGATNIDPVYLPPVGLTPSVRGQLEPWNVHIGIATNLLATSKLDDPTLGGVTHIDPRGSGAYYHYIPVNVLAYWPRVTDVAGFKAKIAALKSPRDGTEALFTSAQVDNLAAKLVGLFDVEDSRVVAKRATLDKAFVDFGNAIYKSVSASNLAPPGAEPDQNNRTAYPNPFVYTPGYSTGGDSQTTVSEYKSTSYLAWERDHAVWKAAKDAYDSSIAAAKLNAASGVAAVKAAQVACEDASHDIETLAGSIYNTLDDLIAAVLSDIGLVNSSTNTNGLITVDPDRIVDSRFYFATWWSAWNEESAPSPVTDMLEVDQNDAVTITRPALPAYSSPTHWMLYRSNVGNNSTAFQLVEKIPVATTSYLDERMSAELGEVCPSVTWAEPPTIVVNGVTNHLRGLRGGPNGVMAGFIDNFVAFCDPYHGYAWPVEYQQPLEYPVVGIGQFGQTWFIGTMGKPYLIGGPDPSSYTPQKMDIDQPCVSARSIVSANGGVFYASPDGYCFCSLSGVEVFTQELFAREDWQKLDPGSIFSVMHDAVLYFWYSGGGGGCYAIDTVAKKLVRHDFLVTAVFDDIATDAVYGVKDNAIYRLFSTGRRTGRWTSGQGVLPSVTAFAWLQVWGDQSPSAPATIRWYCDGSLVHSVDVVDVNPIRLPPGRWREHTIEVVSQARITQVSMASSTDELKQV